MKHTKELILDVSLKLFLQKSFKEVTLKDIVEHTGLSKGAFYHYFTSKEQLFLELINRVFASVYHVPYDSFHKDSLYHFYIDYVNYYAERLYTQGADIPDFHYISLLFDAVKLFPDLKEKVMLSKQVQLDAWKGIIRSARERGEIHSPMEDEQIANMFISTSYGVEWQSVFDESCEDVAKPLLTLWDGFYKALKKEDEVSKEGDTE